MFFCDNNTYWSAIANEGEVYNKTKDLKFNYHAVDYQTFSRSYKAQGRLIRKISAIPLAIWELVNVTSNIFKAVFIGIPKYFKKEGEYLKVKKFCMARNLQGTFGRLAAIFHDKYGLYHIQDSQFHRTCYKDFMDRINYRRSFPPLDVLRKNITNAAFYLALSLKGETIENHSGNEYQSHVSKLVYQSEHPFDNKDHLPKWKQIIDEIRNKRNQFTGSCNKFLDHEVAHLDRLDCSLDPVFHCLAEGYYMQNDRETAFELIKNIVFNIKNKDRFLVKLAKNCYTNDHHDLARAAINEVKEDIKAKNDFLALLKK